jgi:hypothetical protein
LLHASDSLIRRGAADADHIGADENMVMRGVALHQHQVTSPNVPYRSKFCRNFER